MMKNPKILLKNKGMGLYSSFLTRNKVELMKAASNDIPQVLSDDSLNGCMKLHQKCESLYLTEQKVRDEDFPEVDWSNFQKLKVPKKSFLN